MLYRYTGPYAGLSMAQRDAVVALTLDRYVDEIHLPEYLAEVLGLPADDPAHAQAYAERVTLIEQALRTFDDHTWITSILHQSDGGNWTALASMRVVRGCRVVPVAQSIGDCASSLPTHALLRGFAYPVLPGFDVARVRECDLFETTRLVVARPQWITPVVAGEVGADTLKQLLSAALAELSVGAMRLVQRLPDDRPMVAWICNGKPRLAVTLRDHLGVKLVPLYAQGVEPTAAALASPLDAPYFHHWRRELCRDLPPDVLEMVDREGVAAAVRYLAQQDMMHWQDRAVTLPFLTVNDAALETAISRLEAWLQTQPFRLAQYEAPGAHA